MRAMLDHHALDERAFLTRGKQHVHGSMMHMPAMPSAACPASEKSEKYFSFV
jgi:hypothetical protein